MRAPDGVAGGIVQCRTQALPADVDWTGTPTASSFDLLAGATTCSSDAPSPGFGLSPLPTLPLAPTCRWGALQGAVQIDSFSAVADLDEERSLPTFVTALLLLLLIAALLLLGITGWLPPPTPTRSSPAAWKKRRKSRG
jgi:hypothetical protein